GADFELKTPLDSYMLLNAIEGQKRAPRRSGYLPASLHVAIAIKKWREGAFKCVILSYSALPPWCSPVLRRGSSPQFSLKEPQLSRSSTRSPSRRMQRIYPLSSGSIGICGRITWIKFVRADELMERP